MLHSCPFRPLTTRGIIECDCFRLYEKSPLTVIISRIGSKIFKLLEFQNLQVLTKILFFRVELFQRYISNASVRSMGPQNFTQPFITILSWGSSRYHILMSISVQALILIKLMNSF